MTSGVSPFAFSPSASTDVALPSAAGHNWDGNMASVQAAIANRGASPVIGGTNLSAGLDLAVSVLRGTNSSLYTSKVVILLTDGEWNAGRDPTVAAYDARGQGITVHTVSMLTSVQPDLQAVATITGGKYIRTSNTAELQAAFIELAHSLPVVLTD
jgi:Mg-chelatase subunit ChlD